MHSQQHQIKDIDVPLVLGLFVLYIQTFRANFFSVCSDFGFPLSPSTIEAPTTL